MELGSKIKQLRLRADLTQEELADRCELTKGYISQLENDNTSPSIATLEDIVKALGITLADLFSETEEPNVIFKAEKTHYLKNNGNKEAKVLWVSSPPNF